MDANWLVSKVNQPGESTLVVLIVDETDLESLKESVGP
jgi:hypothetical protein